MAVLGRLAAARVMILLQGDGAFRAVLGRFFTAAGFLAGVGIDDVADAVVANFENVGASVFADSAASAKVGIDLRNRHACPPVAVTCSPI